MDRTHELWPKSRAGDMPSPMTVVHTISSVGRPVLGVSAAPASLVRELNRGGEDAESWSLDLHMEISWAEDHLGLHPKRVQAFPHPGPRKFDYSPWLERELCRCKPDVFHQQGIWMAFSRVTWKAH